PAWRPSAFLGALSTEFLRTLSSAESLDASARRTQHPRQRERARMAAQVLQQHWRSTPPVRMLVDRSRNIYLIEHPERVLERNHQDPAGCRGEIARDRQEIQPGSLLARQPRKGRPQRRLGRRAVRIALAGVDSDRAFFP